MICDFLRDYVFPDKPALIIGKGPSLDLIDQVNTDEYFTVSINHALCETKPDLAHIMHYEDFWTLAPFFHRAKGILCPYFPISKPPAKEIQSIDKLPRHENTWAYNMRLYDSPQVGYSAPVEMRGFSLHPVVELLAKAGFQKIRTIGIDGGSTRYAEKMMKYDDARKILEHNKALENFAGYNAQFAYVKELIKLYDLDFDRLYKVVG